MVHLISFGYLMNWIGDVQFAKNISAEKNAELFNLPTTICRLTWFAKKTLFSTFLYYQQLNHNLPNYNLPKRHFNNANVVLTTCNDQQYWSNGRAKVCERYWAPSDSHGREAGRRSELANHDFFVWFAESSGFGKSWVGKLSSANYESANQASGNRYPPLYFIKSRKLKLNGNEIVEK